MVLVLVVLLLLLGGLVDLGRMMYTYVALQNAVGEGAHFGSMYPLEVDEIVYRTQNENVGTVVLWDECQGCISVRYVPNRVPDGPRVGDSVVVRVEYPFRMIGPLHGVFGWDGVIVLVSEASQRILSSVP